MGDIKHINIPLSNKNFNIAEEVKNGESWPVVFMRLINEEKKRREKECPQSED